jgi:hypothetical protein
MRHRLVYDAVHDMMHTEIHALAITAIGAVRTGREAGSGSLKKSVRQLLNASTKN